MGKEGSVVMENMGMVQADSGGGGAPLAEKGSFWRKLIQQRQLLFMILPFVAYIFLFSYAPLWGWSMAFQNYKPGREVQDWVGLYQFRFLFMDDTFLEVLRNTLSMSVINLVSGTLTTLLFTLLLNEMRTGIFKRVIQTVSYLPHFLSWVIVASLVSNILSIRADGILNEILVKLGIIKEPILWLGNPKYFWTIVAVSHIWKNLGWNSIIYLSAISSIDPELYEAAEIDGANRYHRMWHITLPGIRPTIVVILIMNVGWLLNAGFEIQYLLGSTGAVVRVSRTIDIFVLRYGIELNNYSLATAAGMFKTLVSLIMIMGTNWVTKKLGAGGLL